MLRSPWTNPSPIALTRQPNLLFTGVRNAMKKQTMTFHCGFFLILSALSLFSFTSAPAADLVSVKDGLLSVNLKDTSLLEVARDIEKQSDVWFRGDETLFQEKISVTFNDLPLEEGLKRILTNLNYSLMFDTKNKVAGVMVMGEGKPAGTQPGRPGAQPPRVAPPPGTSTRPAPTVRSRPSTSNPPPATVRRPPRAVPLPAEGGVASQAPGSGAAQSATPEAFKVQENAPTPGGPASSDGPLPPAFRVIENAPSPGGTEEGTGVSPGGSTPARNAPSPGEASKSDSTP